METSFSNTSPETTASSRFEALRSLKKRKPTAFGAATVLVVLGVLSCCIAGPVAWLIMMGLTVILSGRFDFTFDSEMVESILCCMGPFVVIGVVFLLVGILVLGVGGDERRA